jgi:anti-sigma B factor antagonist
LRAIVRELIEDRRLVVLLHMAGVTDMDAHGIGVLVSSLTTLERCGGRMALIGPSAHVRRLLAITKLDTVLKIYDSETEAIVSSRPIAITTASRNRLPWSESVAVLDGSI